tara:strand:+ start:14311 stop:16500 length:2190 start_codon:yes stop_codon:yes gene_type:complete
MGLTSANYDDLFENIGEFIERINEFAAYYAPLEAGRDEIEEQLKTNDQIDSYVGVKEIFEGYKSSVQGWIYEMVGKVTELLTDKTHIVDKFALQGNNSFLSVYQKLYQDMVTSKGADILNTASNASGHAFTVTVPSIGSGLGTAVTLTMKNGAGILLVPSSYEIFVNQAGTDAQTADFIIKAINGEVPDADAISGNTDIKYGSSVGNGVPGVTASDGTGSTTVTFSADATSGNSGDNITLANTAGSIYQTGVSMAPNESVTASVVSLGAATTTAAVSGRSLGTVATGSVLDGYNVPLTGSMINIYWNGANSQLANTSETMTLTCTSDSDTGGATAGETELFQLEGNESNPNYHWDAAGSGIGPSISPLQGETYLSNANFEDFTANAPDNWTVDSGTAGTHIDDGDTTEAAGTATFTFGDTEFDDVNNGTITLIDAVGTSVIYKIKNDYSAVAGSQEFNAGASATAAAANFEALVESSDGHNGTITIVSSSGQVTLTQATAGKNGYTTITTAASFDNACDVNPPAAFSAIGNEVYRGSKSLVFIGDGAQATIGISQALTEAELDPYRRYCILAQVGKSGVAAVGAGTLTIQLEGTGYTATAAEKIELNAGALAALGGTNLDYDSYTLQSCYINLPTDIPSDLKLVIKVTGTLTSSARVLVDNLAFGPVTYFGGAHVVLSSGRDKWLKDDKVTWTVANNNAGVIQTFFRKAYALQLPSSGAPTIAEALATD